MCYHIEFSRSISNRVGVGRVPKFGGCCVAASQKFGDAVPPPLKMGRVRLTPRKTLLPHNVAKSVEFGCSRSNHVGVDRVPKFLGTLGPRPIKIRYF